MVIKIMLGATIDPVGMDKSHIAAGEIQQAPARRELRADFPKVHSRYHANKLLNTMENELGMAGHTLDDLDRVYVLSPLKDHRIFPASELHNTRKERKETRTLAALLHEKKPNIQWIPTRSIVETVKLSRSEDQTALHALTGKQHYDILSRHKRQVNPFDDGGDDQAPPLFILTDWAVEQGTTMANMASFIEHNGGKVIIMCSGGRHEFVQYDTRNEYWLREPLTGIFADASRNTGQLNGLASYVVNRLGAEQTPQDIMIKLEAALNGVGTSVVAMTNGEVDRIIRNCRGSLQEYEDLIYNLEAVPIKNSLKL